MDARDICAIGDVLAESLSGATKRVQEVHEAVAQRSFAAAGPARSLPERVHDRIAARIYGTVRTVGPAAIRSGALGLGTAVDPDAARVYGSPRGKAIVSALNGAFGDALARRGNSLALRMRLRSDGTQIDTSARELARALPEATARVVVFIHGFGETDDSWRWFARSHWSDPSINYGQLLRRELGYTPLWVHYNSGRAVEVNGIELSELLEELAINWPVPLEELVLIAHSAGGHVARAAIRDGVANGDRWVRLVRQLLALGSPRSAQVVERAAQASARALSALPETRPLSDMLDVRSAGLKDLVRGSENGIPRWIEHVELPGKGAPRIGHFRLLNHPFIYRQIKGRLSARSAPVPARVAREARSARVGRALRAPIPSRRH